MWSVSLFFNFYSIIYVVKKDGGTKSCKLIYYNMAVLLNEKIRDQSVQFLQICSLFATFQLFLKLCMLTSEVLLLKCHHSISVKCSEYQNTGPTDPSLGKMA